MSKSLLALVTGASRGLGREIAVGLANSGFTVIAVARSKSALLSLSEEYAGSIFGYEADVSDYVAVDQLAVQVLRDHGVVQILINAAGVFGPIDLIHKTDPEQ